MYYWEFLPFRRHRYFCRQKKASIIWQEKNIHTQGHFQQLNWLTNGH